MAGKDPELIFLALDDIVEHEENPNKANRTVLLKIKNHIKTSGQYPPLIVCAEKDLAHGKYRLVDGHQRKRVLAELFSETGDQQYNHVKCDNWGTLTLLQQRILLASLNELRGANVPVMRAELLDRINTEVSREDMAKLLPETEAEIKQTISLLQTPMDNLESLLHQEEMPDVITMMFALDPDKHETMARLINDIYQFANERAITVSNIEQQVNENANRTAIVTFSITGPQQIIVEGAIKEVVADTGITGRNVRGRAIELICADYLAGAGTYNNAQ